MQQKKNNHKKKIFTLGSIITILIWFNCSVFSICFIDRNFSDIHCSVINKKGLTFLQWLSASTNCYLLLILKTIGNFLELHRENVISKCIRHSKYYTNQKCTLLFLLSFMEFKETILVLFAQLRQIFLYKNLAPTAMSESIKCRFMQDNEGTLIIVLITNYCMMVWLSNVG